ncbi:MAG: hypothetical protein M1814_005437 [Vezdaea aestivalis]|nr:MAG: hypothetical protein M1814_005437 [Vezdaea aestivalis]
MTATNFSGKVVVPINDYTDGRSDRWPVTKPNYKTHSHDDYMAKLGAAWMFHRGEAIPGVQYTLDRLPSGYQLYKRPRPSTGQINNFLFGHPSGRFFNSPNNFEEHFIWLMQYRPDGRPCSRKVCFPPKRKTTKFSITDYARDQVDKSEQNSRRPSPDSHQPQIRPVGRPRIHEPQPPPESIYKTYLRRFRDENINEGIHEKANWNWRLVSDLVVPEAVKILSLPSSWPRLGEVVLFDRNEGNDTPQWEAGIISQTPDQSPTKEDPFLESHTNLTNFGFQIDPLKPWKRSNATLEAFERSERAFDQSIDCHSYHALLNIRPFGLFRELAKPAKDHNYSPSIELALKYAASFALVMKYHVRGIYPNLEIFSKGIWLGAELLLVGDSVQVLPTKLPTDPSEPKESYLLEIKSIRLEIRDINDRQSRSAHVYVYGKAAAFAMESGRRYKTPLHPPSNMFVVPLARIFGRAYSPSALTKWFPAATPSKLGVKGISQARRFSAEHDPRISRHDNRIWHWAESRADQLELGKFNGLLVGEAARNRVTDDEAYDDPDTLLRLIKVLDRFEKAPGLSQVEATGSKQGSETESGIEVQMDDGDGDDNNESEGEHPIQTQDRVVGDERRVNDAMLGNIRTVDSKPVIKSEVVDEASAQPGEHVTSQGEIGGIRLKKEDDLAEHVEIRETVMTDVAESHNDEDSREYIIID